MTLHSTLVEKIKEGKEIDSHLKNLKIEANLKEISFKKPFAEFAYNNSY